jgi:hypothetical protein
VVRIIGAVYQQPYGVVVGGLLARLTCVVQRFQKAEQRWPENPPTARRIGQVRRQFHGQIFQPNYRLQQFQQILGKIFSWRTPAEWMCMAVSFAVAP